MHFDLTDLSLFLACAEERNLTRAAVRQHMSLAAASARVKMLEAEAGLPLFEREPRGMRLTPPGEAFLHHARLMLRQVDDLRGDLVEYSSGLHGHLRIFANTTGVTDILPGALSAFLATYPKVNVDLQERPNAEIPPGIRSGRADIGIIAGDINTLDLETVHFSTDRLVLIVARQHIFASRNTIEFAEILEEHMIGMYRSSTLQTFLSQVADSLGKSLRLRVQLNSFDAVCQMTSRNVGVAIVPESVARRNLDNMKLAMVHLSDSWSVRERYLIVRKLPDLPAYARALVDHICHQGHLIDDEISCPPKAQPA